MIFQNFIPNSPSTKFYKNCFCTNLNPLHILSKMEQLHLSAKFLSGQPNNKNDGNSKNPFRSKFLPPIRSVEEIAAEQQQFKISSAFVERLRTDIEVSGGDGSAIAQISSFAECNLSKEMHRNLRHYKEPTPVQRQVIPLIQHTGCDLLCLSATGSGKTGAFLIPIINHLQSLRKADSRAQDRETFKPKAVVVAHTKELVQQLYENARLFAHETGVGVALAQGNMSRAHSQKQLCDGCDILVCTPGRLKHYASEMMICVSEIRYVVIDEVDKFGTEHEFLEALKELMLKMGLSGNRGWRTFMFSATLHLNFGEMTSRFLRDNFFFVEVGKMNQTVAHVPVRIERIDLDGRAKRLKLQDKFLRPCSVEKERPDGSKYFECKRTLIFVNEGRQCDRLAIALCSNRYRANCVNGHRTSEQRNKAVHSFNRGEFDIMVGTDVMARGLNLRDVERVILYDMPPELHYLQFIHRVGRTGRHGNDGEAIVFFDVGRVNDLKLADFVYNQLHSTGQPVPEWLARMALSNERFRREAREEAANTPLHCWGATAPPMDDGFATNNWS